jgi:hypothetical protein
MAVSTYNAISSVTLSSAQSQVTFSNIPQIYTDLVLVVSAKLTATPGSDIVMLFNGDNSGVNGTSGNYSTTVMYGNGSAAGTTRLSNFTRIYTDYYGAPDATNYGANVVNIMNYSNTTTFKTAIMRANSTIGVDANVGLWRSTLPITSVTLFLTNSPSFAAGTTFNIYGVGANQLKASGGDVIVSDGTYWYHAFKKSGTFTPTSALTCDILRISGGGGGGYNLAGGGGAGGIVLSSAQSLTASAYTATIGAGGAGSTSSGVIGGIGTATTFTGTGLSLSTVYPGGGGRGDYGATYASASTVASAGGMTGAASGAGGTTSTGQGNNGGANGTAGYNAGGGGGAGAVGATGSNSVSGVGGAGGAGINTYSSWATATATGVSGYYAGGGGGCGMKTALGTGAIGGLGGAGGGGQGGSDNGVSGANHMLAMAAIPNTGSGGGGGGWDQYNALHANGANGGSGLVIVRYAV